MLDRDTCRHLSRRRLLGTALTGAVAAVISSCAESGDGPAGKTDRTVTDLTGAPVRLSGPVRRVVTIPLPAASMIVAVSGSPAVLVGMNAASRSAIEGSYLGAVHPELLQVPTDVAGQDFAPNVESVLAAEPDVVIQWGDRGPGIVEPLRNVGLPVAQLTYGTQEALEGAVRLYGELLGEQDRAGRIIGEMTAGLNRLRERPRTGPAQSVLYLDGGAEDMRAAGSGSYNQYVTELVGARNPASDIRQERGAIDIERLLAWDPDVIVLGNFGPAVPRDMYDDPALGSLRAVRDRRIYKVPLGGYRWDPPSQESPLMWQWLDALVQGTRAPGLRAEIVRQYGFLYGAEPSDAQLDTILAMGANRESRGYADFGR